ncbi:hypothetical protein MMC12_004140 [Toensbergia leucococca]|nr:hypothetical protein [Toensbergia leucococca]
MALPYPEGEVYFKSATLKLNNFDASDDMSFYSNFLVEYVWNRPYCTNFEIETTKNHPRSTLRTGFGDLWATRFGVWDTTYVLFSDKDDGTGVFRQAVIKNNENFNETRDFDSSGTRKTRICAVPMGPEKYMYIDLTVPIRAIYFPIASKSSQVNENLCTYLMVDFRLRKGVKMRSRDSDSEHDVPYSYKDGLNFRAYQSLCFNIPGIYALLALPQQMRNMDKGLYQTTVKGEELINLWGAENINKGRVKYGAPSNSTTIEFSRLIDLATVLLDNFGVDISWTPYEHSSWVLNFLQQVSTLGLAFIPIAGPLISVSFAVGLKAITDPDTFKSENVLGLTADVMAAVLATALAMKGNVPTSFLGKKTVFLSH